ncbi:hypothetical protein KDA00_05900, partial [Candidatus Saccharibacteria bacterium]|nr:hypothetical protein [Candidatus Saccharibacteria bacterium]
MKKRSNLLINSFSAVFALLLTLTPVSGMALPSGVSDSGGYIQGRVFRDVNTDYVFNDSEKSAPGDVNRLN